MKRWLICPDSFKDAASAQVVTRTLAKGIRQVSNDAVINEIPLSDGGDGFIALGKALGWGKIVAAETCDALQRNRTAEYLFDTDSKTAWLGVAEASGIQELSPEERDGRITTSLGTGQLIAHALKQGAKQLFVGLGGSATNDGGCGMAVALGYRFIDAHGHTFLPTGATLKDINKIIPPVSTALKNATFIALSDVLNPLYGPNGATYTFGPQKGIPSTALADIDAGMQHLSDCWQQCLGKEVAHTPGAGAAGGLGAACLAFLDGTIQSGTRSILQLAQVEKAIQEADAIVTGEGRVDESSFQGKLISGVLELCQQYNKPCYLVCGQAQLPRERLRQKGIFDLYAVQDYHKNSADSITKTVETLEKIGIALGHTII